MRIELQPAYILHTRPFRDTSLLVDFFTLNYGRITLIAKGARNPKKHQRQLLQPFQPVTVSWQGKGELKTLIAIESADQGVNLVGQFLYSALYANELLTYLLAQGDVATDVYRLYGHLLAALEQQTDLEPNLRTFEFSLLSILGYEINFESEAKHGQPIKPDENYAYVNEVGFIAEIDCDDEDGIVASYPGEQLMAIAEQRYDAMNTRKIAKKITRAALSTLLQGKKIKSRELFAAVTNNQK